MFFDNISESANTETMDINHFLLVSEAFTDYDNDLSYVSEAAASWEAMKSLWNEHKTSAQDHWKKGKKLERSKDYKGAVKEYDIAIADAKKVYKVIDSIPNENIMDFLVGFLPYISYALWGIILVGTVKTGKIKGASRAYVRSLNDKFIKQLIQKRNECAKKA